MSFLILKKFHKLVIILNTSMTTQINNSHLNNLKNDFWLHRYFPSKYLRDSFTLEKFNLRFTRINKFSDGLEGWDYSIPNFKEVMKILAIFNNRVKLDGGEIVESDYISIKMIAGGLSHLKNRAEIIEKLEINRKGRQENFASCWFASESKKYENRVMWQLYANKKEATGLMISVKWSELKAFLDINDIIFTTGFIDYSDDNKNKEVLFKKEKSYSHENEFRIVYKPTNNNQTNSIIGINNDVSPQINCTIWDSHKVNETVKELENLGFTNKLTSKSKRTYSVSKLVPEFI